MCHGVCILLDGWLCMPAWGGDVSFSPIRVLPVLPHLYGGRQCHGKFIQLIEGSGETGDWEARVFCLWTWSWCIRVFAPSFACRWGEGVRLLFSFRDLFSLERLC